MAFSDLPDIQRGNEVATEPSGTLPDGSPHPGMIATGALGAELAEPNPTEPDSGEAVTEKRVALPKPDTNNITVLTESLPNEPILPWHRFDSPWLEKEEEPTAEAALEAASIPSSDDDCHEQLSLALDGVSSEEATPEHDQSNGDPLNARQIQ